MRGIWKAALAASGLAAAALLLWPRSPLQPDKPGENAMPLVRNTLSTEYSVVKTLVPLTSVLVSDSSPNVNVGNDGLVFELSQRNPVGKATVDFTDRSQLLDRFFTKSTIAFELHACSGKEKPIGTVRVRVLISGQAKPEIFILNEATPTTGTDTIRYLWRPLEIAASWETARAPVQPDCALLVARIDAPRTFETSPGH